jgi:hypothetical protein
MSRANAVHLKWSADPLCEQRFPKPRLTTNPRAVTCCACRSVAGHRLRTTHRAPEVPPGFVPTNDESIALATAAGWIP